MPPLSEDLNHVRNDEQRKEVPRSVLGECEHRSSKTLHLSWNVCSACHLESFRRRLKIQLTKSKSPGGPMRSPIRLPFPRGIQSGGWINPDPFGRCDSASHQNGTLRVYVSGDFG